jgi:hypothetical protein
MIYPPSFVVSTEVPHSSMLPPKVFVHSVSGACAKIEIERTDTSEIIPLKELHKIRFKDRIIGLTCFDYFTIIQPRDYYLIKS